MKKIIKHLILNYLADKGIEYKPLEKTTFMESESILATKGAFNRKFEKDDGWLFFLSRNATSILDIGCNVGQSSLLMTVKNNNEIVCCDPNPKALARCAENLIINRLSNRARFINAFIGDEDNVNIRFYASLVDAAGSMFRTSSKSSRALNKSFSVPMMTAENLCQSIGYQPNLIKIDVEGAEHKVLKGIGDYILRKKPKIIVEVHRLTEEGMTIEANTNMILTWCSNNNYSAYYLTEHEIIENSKKISHRGRYHLLLLHSEESYPKGLNKIPENTQADYFY